MDLVFFGIQGSGKGTQARKLVEDFGYAYFEAGGELRKIKDSGTPLGETVKRYIDEGHLVPFTIIMQVVEAFVTSKPPSQQILFDGIPRDLDQMRSFDAIMEKSGRSFRCVQIVLPEDVAFARILGRAKAEGRTDDADPEKIRRRMQLFTEKTMPVIDAYRTKGLVIDVDGSGTVEEIYRRLKTALALRQAQGDNCQ